MTAPRPERVHALVDTMQNAMLAETDPFSVRRAGVRGLHPVEAGVRDRGALLTYAAAHAPGLSGSALAVAAGDRADDHREGFMIFTLKPKKDRGQWHRWFAWRPVPLYRNEWAETRRWVWLQWVERRTVAHGWVQEYRL